jgi:hypothetical protein
MGGVPADGADGVFEDVLADGAVEVAADAFGAEKDALAPEHYHARVVTHVYNSMPRGHSDGCSQPIQAVLG